jgi:hypothetical protein
MLIGNKNIGFLKGNIKNTKPEQKSQAYQALICCPKLENFAVCHQTS